MTALLALAVFGAVAGVMLGRGKSVGAVFLASFAAIPFSVMAGLMAGEAISAALVAAGVCITSLQAAYFLTALFSSRGRDENDGSGKAGVTSRAVSSRGPVGAR